MFQGMFRKRGRPPDPPLQIGGYDNLDQRQEDTQIPGHQLRDAPRQLPLPSVREFEQVTDVQQEQPGFNNAIVELSQSSHQHDVDMLDPYNRRLSQDPQHFYMSLTGRAAVNAIQVVQYGSLHLILIFSSSTRSQLLLWRESTLLEDFVFGSHRATSTFQREGGPRGDFEAFERSKNVFLTSNE